MPNVVRNLVGARIIKQYISYCKETGFDHLSERELYRVFKHCPAQQKKALQGVDNISADGLHGVEMLGDVIRKLGERDKKCEWVTEAVNLLLTFKSYLKGSYRLHISTSSSCPDHCTVFALSDSLGTAFPEKCDHSHELVCNNCKSLYHLENLIKNAFSDQSQRKICSMMYRSVLRQSMYGNNIYYEQYTETRQGKMSWPHSILEEFLSCKILQ